MPVDPFNTRTSLIAEACAGKSEAIDDFCRFYKPLIINRLKSSKGLQTADAEQEVLMTPAKKSKPNKRNHQAN